jgi:hypothetical protein
MMQRLHIQAVGGPQVSDVIAVGLGSLLSMLILQHNAYLLALHAN